MTKTHTRCNRGMTAWQKQAAARRLQKRRDAAAGKALPKWLQYTAEEDAAFLKLLDRVLAE